MFVGEGNKLTLLKDMRAMQQTRLIGKYLGKCCNQTSSPAPTSTDNFSKNFNDTTDWVANDDFFEIDVLDAEHEKGRDITVQVFQLIAGEHELITLNSLIINSNGDVKIISDEKFAGKIVIS